jgi:hypothetical protein
VFDGVNFGGTTEFSTPTYRSIRRNVEALRALVGFSTSPIPPACFTPPMRRTSPAMAS